MQGVLQLSRQKFKFPGSCPGGDVDHTVTFPCLFEDMADILPKYLFVCLNKTGLFVKDCMNARGQTP